MIALKKKRNFNPKNSKRKKNVNFVKRPRKNANFVQKPRKKQISSKHSKTTRILSKGRGRKREFRQKHVFRQRVAEKKLISPNNYKKGNFDEENLEFCTCEFRWKAEKNMYWDEVNIVKAYLRTRISSRAVNVKRSQSTRISSKDRKKSKFCQMAAQNSKSHENIAQNCQFKQRAVEKH